MGQKVCLDTDVAIELIKDTPIGRAFFASLMEADIFLATTSVFELFRRKTNLDVIELFMVRTHLLSFDEKAARSASEIDKELEKNGTPIGFRDIFIAATAMVNGCELATLNVKDFSRIKGLKLVKLR
ncbi:type II toxin-antitoxin system VapC family toxin [Candidatus Woesearchaeota archaeon]|nr:type II toxin-antitoxin system VapC family toxin [Candidatus Woesearchaeota archaeon]